MADDNPERTMEQLKRRLEELELKNKAEAELAQQAQAKKQAKRQRRKDAKAAGASSVSASGVTTDGSAAKSPVPHSEAAEKAVTCTDGVDVHHNKKAKRQEEVKWPFVYCDKCGSTVAKWKDFLSERRVAEWPDQTETWFRTCVECLMHDRKIPQQEAFALIC